MIGRSVPGWNASARSRSSCSGSTTSFRTRRSFSFGSLRRERTRALSSSPGGSRRRRSCCRFAAGCPVESDQSGLGTASRNCSRRVISAQFGPSLHRRKPNEHGACWVFRLPARGVHPRFSGAVRKALKVCGSALGCGCATTLGPTAGLACWRLWRVSCSEQSHAATWPRSFSFEISSACLLVPLARLHALQSSCRLST